MHRHSSHANKIGWISFWRWFYFYASFLRKKLSLWAAMNKGCCFWKTSTNFSVELSSTNRKMDTSFKDKVKGDVSYSKSALARTTDARWGNAFTARPKIHSHSQIFRYGGSIFCLPHRPIFSDILDLCLHWVSVVRGLSKICFRQKNWDKSQ